MIGLSWIGSDWVEKVEDDIPRGAEGFMREKPIVICLMTATSTQSEAWLLFLLYRADSKVVPIAHASDVCGLRFWYLSTIDMDVCHGIGQAIEWLILR